MSKSPSRSKSPQARPRPTFGDSNAAPTWPATSRNFPPPRFRKSCGGWGWAAVSRMFFKGLLNWAVGTGGVRKKARKGCPEGEAETSAEGGGEPEAHGKDKT